MTATTSSSAGSGALIKSSDINIVAVVASARNDVIGYQGAMPWHQPADLAHFKALTLGGTMVMGRKTFDSLGRKPLPGRRNLVLTRNPRFESDGVDAVQSLRQACELASSGTLFVIGGDQIYRLCWPEVNELYWTRIDAAPAGDAWFRPDLSDFERRDREDVPADARNAYPMAIEHWVRCAAPQVQG
ncbi:MAG: dihydrofolate reductase [Oceanococcaceae bacterium]